MTDGVITTRAGDERSSSTSRCRAASRRSGALSRASSPGGVWAAAALAALCSCAGDLSGDEQPAHRYAPTSNGVSLAMGVVTGGIYNYGEQPLVGSGAKAKEIFDELYQQLGARWIRIEANWQNDDGSTVREEQYREIVRKAHAAGLKVIVVVNKCWDGSSIDSWTPDVFIDRKSWPYGLAYLSSKVFTGKATPDAYELLNEPTEPCNGRRMDGNTFSWFLRRVWDWRQRQSSFPLIISGAPLNTGKQSNAWWKSFWASGMWAEKDSTGAQKPRPFDYFGIHPYNPWNVLHDYDSSYTSCNPYWPNFVSKTLADINAIGDAIDGKYGHPAGSRWTKLFVTEFGYSNEVNSGPVEDCPNCMCSESTAAQAMDKIVRQVFEASKRIVAALWYDYRDYPGTLMGLRGTWSSSKKRYPAKRTLWDRFAELAGGAGTDPEATWTGGGRQNGGPSSGNSAGSDKIGADPSGAVDSAIAACHSRNGGTAAAGRPFDNGGGASVHGWGPGRLQDFKGGSLGPNMCMRKKGAAKAWMVRGDIRDAYLAAGGGPGRLGYPVEEEHSSATGPYQKFERGYITWDAAAGAYRPTVTSSSP